MIKRYCLICKFLCVPFLINAQSSLFRFADSIYQTKNYRLAALEYERIIFEDPAPSARAQAALGKAACLKAQQQYSSAAAYLNETSTVGIPDTLRFRILFQSALNAYLAHQPDQAYSKLEIISHFYPDSAERKDMFLLKILSLNEAQRWKEADTAYSRFIRTYYPNLPLQNNPYLKIPRLKNPETAEKLSAYLPLTGAGEFYAGNIPEGMLNALLQIGLLGFGAYNIIIQHYITGILIGAGGYASFYNGSKRRAKKLTELYNEKETLKFNTRVREQLMALIKK